MVGIGLWRERSDLAAAAQALPQPLTDALAATVAEGQGDWHYGAREDALGEGSVS